MKESIERKHSVKYHYEQTHELLELSDLALDNELG